MTIIPLSDKEWEEIHVQLLDCEPLGQRIIKLPPPDYLPLQVYYEDSERLRSSNVCLRDAGKFLGKARLALRLAIGVRKYYMGESQSNSDEAWLLAHFESQFYADYVPLLLYSSSEHAHTALAFLFEINVSGNGSIRPRILNKIPNNPNADTTLKKALKEFDDSSARKAIWKYRNDWVHNKPMRVASPFFDPPRKRTPDTETIQGATIYLTEPPKYIWDKLIDLLKQALSDTHEILTVCVDEWDRHFVESNTIE